MLVSYLLWIVIDSRYCNIIEFFGSNGDNEILEEIKNYWNKMCIVKKMDRLVRRLLGMFDFIVIFEEELWNMMFLRVRWDYFRDVF